MNSVCNTPSTRFTCRLILGNYLAQQGVMARGKLKGCFLISVPWNVFAATKNTEENYFNLMMNKYLAGHATQEHKASALRDRVWIF